MEDLKILVVDDEAANLQKLQRTFYGRYPVLAAGSGHEALEIIRKNSGIAVVIADQRMPDMTGVDLLRQTLVLLPEAVRIILTGYTDVDVLVAAINSCKVYRYIVKPWDPPDLLMTVERGLEAYRLAAENARFRKELIRRERLARELEIASEIQRYILPPQYPNPEGYEIGVEYHPAREVGGDLYDFEWDREAGSLQIAIGDVSGKSIPAALYGAVFSGQLRTLFAQSWTPSEILARANSSLIARYQVSNFIAVACLRIQVTSGACLLSNGGMPLPYLVREGRVERLSIFGIPLGLIDGTSYDQLPFAMEAGDLLVFASDGVSDAMNFQGEMYEEHRFIESIGKHAGDDAVRFARSVYQEVCEFTRDAEVHDDITIITLRRTS